MTNEEIIEQLENAIGLIKQDGKDWLDDRDIPILEACIKSLTALDKTRSKILECLSALDEIEKSGFNIYLPNEMSGRRLTYRQCLEFIDKYKADSEPQESEAKCKNCKYYRNPDYTRCHECKAESEDKE